MNKKLPGFLQSFLLLIIVLIPMLLPAGCSNNAADKEEEFIGSTADPIINKKITPIIFYFPGNQPKSWPAVKAKIEEEISGSVNATLDFKWFEFAEYYKRMSILSVSEERFDAFCLGKPDSDFYPDFTKLAREGKLKDISQLFSINAPNLMAEYTREELSYGQVDGKQYAIPSLFPHAYATYLMLDDALMKKYGIQKVSNYLQYEAFLKAVKENEPDLIPGIIANGIDTLKLFARGSNYVIVDYMQKLVYKWDDPQMKVFAWEQTPEFKEAVNYLAGWYKKKYLGVIPEDQSKVASFVYYGELSPPSDRTGKMGYSGSSGVIKESNPLRVFYLYPDSKVQRDNPAGTFFFNGSFVFPSTSANTERALQFLDWVQRSRDNYFLMMYGIEGKDYVLNKEYDYPMMPEGVDFANRTYMFWDGSWAFENIGYLPVRKDKNGNKMEGQKQFLEKNSKYAPHGALYPNYKGIETAAENRSAKFTNFEDKIRFGGLVDTSEVDNFIKEMKELGTDNLVAEVQRQLDEAVKARKQ